MKESEIFDLVVAEADDAARNSLLDELCADEAMKQRVQKLVSAYDQPNSFYNDPADVAANRDFEQTHDYSPAFARPGLSIGPYKLLQQVGEGGMGLVFMAEQTKPVLRRVALKVIKPGMDSQQIIARFEAERQALAMMDHPNIAKVLDAGTTDTGYPFFVMELVNGIPITQYCDQETLSTKERLEMFVSVCQAVQHAHHKGIIHRDLKPNNILVAEYDGKPIPKVIDFGVAKATGARLTEKTLFTEFGQLIGTLEYMSPEQSRRNQLDVDTRSDIYSLGIVLYKLLTGATPFESERFRKAAWDEMMKIIREEDPPLPSVKIGSSASLNQIASQRRIEPSRLSSLVKGDLDWIVLKSLEKDRSRRYPTAGELAEDITRHLSQHPVSARPHSTVDVLSKYARRNRSKLAIAAAVVALVGFIGLMFANSIGEMSARSQRLNQLTLAASAALEVAEKSAIGDEAPWDTATVQIDRVREILASGVVDKKQADTANVLLEDFEFKKSERQLAIQIEECVIQSATHVSLESWQRMEREMRDFFRLNGFDLDKEKPEEIGRKIRDSRSAIMWADFLELWIAAKAHMPGLGGPPVTRSEMQPWADAIYVADPDPVRTAVRKFIYTPPWKKENLPAIFEEVDPASLSPRTLSWIASVYSMVQEFEKSDQILRTALELYPRDLMLTHDCGYTFYHQQRYEEAARMYHRCIAIRSDVAGIWKSLSMTLEKLGETKEAERALQMSRRIAGE